MKKTFQTTLGAASARYPSQVEPLAAPPAGSDLKPVMGDYGMPLLGHTLETLADPLPTMLERYERFGPLSWSGSLGMKIVQVVGPAAVEQAWMNKDKAFSSEQGWEPIIGPFFRRGIMLMDFDEHMAHRRILQQAFSRPRLLAYLDLMNPRISATLDGWELSSSFPVYTRAKDMLLAVANEVFMGVEIGDQAAELAQAFEAAVHGGQAIIRADVKYGTWARGLRGRERLQEFFRSEIAGRRAGAGDDLFSVLCHSESAEGETFTDEDIVNHMIFAMMAAHDTSTIAVSMMTYFLGRDPAWQDRVRAESLALDKKTLDYDDLDALPSLDLAFKETLRYNAPVGMLFRKAIKDTELVGQFIPKGTVISINPWATMQLAQWWPNPTTWDPDRFAPQRREDKVHRFAWAPFGGGAHKCIGLYFGGMEVKAIMHQMVQQFEWTVPAGYFPAMTYGTGPTPADGLPIDIRRR
ncbi:cytochrome P450 [Gordonia sp. TBRC 11910]|uniref:Cytochrome P450 n=1 Tax=Gordonia asplenii TaxID=2725283 RepID=A0A848KPY6_9ACTN|nr:cytochrome P450 [Gordonia asplenii]NMO00400.1 cytochrome P450 [Gordonia asplenii]